MIEHILQHEQAGDIRFSFFDGAVELLHLLARRGGAAAHCDLMRTDAMRHLVRHDVREERVEAQIALRRGW